MRLGQVRALGRKAAALAAGAIALLSASCGSDAVTLTHAEAIRVIRAGLGYPRTMSYTFTQISPSSPFGLEISRLLREDYLRAPEYEFIRAQQVADLEPTEKGKELVEGCRYWPRGTRGDFSNYAFRPYTHVLDVAGIEELLIDTPNRTAVLRFKLSATPSEYFKRLSGLDSVRANEVRLPTHGTARLKKWDQGWRIEQKK